MDRSAGTRHTFIPSPVRPTFRTSNYPSIQMLLPYLNPLRSLMKKILLQFQPGLGALRHCGNVWDGRCAPSGGKSQVHLHHPSGHHSSRLLLHFANLYNIYLKHTCILLKVPLLKQATVRSLSLLSCLAHIFISLQKVLRLLPLFILLVGRGPGSRAVCARFSAPRVKRSKRGRQVHHITIERVKGK
jgi:hypothetical protein